MATPSYTPIQTTDLHQVQREVQKTFQAVGPLAGARILRNQTINTVETVIPHFGRKDWSIWNAKSHATVKQSKDPDDKNIYLIASATLVCSVVLA